ncbi:ATP-binding protein [Streptomyces sp. LP05-1]|uniref:ATP-binding protein n=1 Tax=Streptomyces pyxinae TaxID=2970734 RepID=A0ABT2CQM6_9ACTN|nr:ATP-binding protein [Streptomyces sp. LP05-1]MCS0639746.1 ATP-binding protein [Streptomyces sp. LP05-1]
MVVVDSPSCDSASARDVTARFLADHCPWADLAAVQLVVTELTANALRHTQGWWRLRLRAEPEGLMVELDDSSTKLPTERAPDFAGGGGFGWPMIQRLAGRVEVRPRPAGKTVCAMWPRPLPGAG